MRPVFVLALLAACGDPSATPDPSVADPSATPDPSVDDPDGAIPEPPGDDRPVLGQAGDPLWDDAHALLADGRARADGWRDEVELARDALGTTMSFAPPCTGVVAWRGGEGYPSLQEAFEAASLDPVVLVCPGVHTEGASLLGEGQLRIVAPLVPESDVVVDGGGVRNGFEMLRSSLVLIDLTVRNAPSAVNAWGPVVGLVGCTVEGSGVAGSGAGSAVYVRQPEVAVLLGNHFVGNVVGYGSAAWVNGGHVVVADNVFEGNHATDGAAALQISTAYGGTELAVVLAGNVFERNVTDDDGLGALEILSVPAPLVAALLGDVFRDNQGDGTAMIRATYPTADARVGLYDVTFEGNDAGVGSDPVLRLGDPRGELQASLVRSRFEGNAAPDGNIIDVSASGGTIVLADTVLEDNTAINGAALAFHDSGNGRVELWDLEVSGNDVRAALDFEPMHDLDTSGPDVAHLHGGRIAGNTTFHEALVSETWDLAAVGVDFGTGSDDNTGGDVAGCGGLGDGATVLVAPDGTTTCL